MASFLDKIGEKLGFSKSSSKSVLGIDIGSSSIKLVQLRKEKEVAVLETYGELALGSYADQEVGQVVKLSSETISEALKDLLKEADVTTKECGLSIPYSSSLVSFIEVPNVSEDELEEMIPIEARKYVPVPISEVMLDWYVIPEEPGTESGKKREERDRINVMLVAIHNENLEEYNRVISQTELSFHFYEIEAFSTVRAVLGQGVEPVMIMDMGAGLTKMYIVERGVIKYSHSINKGSQGITESLARSMNVTKAEAEKTKRESGLEAENRGEGLGGSAEVTLNYILNEANKVLISYQKENHKNVNEVILTGGGALLKGLLEKAEENLDAEVSLADPFSKVKSPAFLEDTLKEAGPAFGVSIGVALRLLEEVD